tara:strand:- start:2756 stop:3151 length:396 start_codon:yes stop_codon:yes gene_type:complete
MQLNPTIDISSSKIWIHEGDIIWQDYKLAKSLSIEDAKEISVAVNEIASFTPEGKKLLLSSMSGLLSMEQEARDCLINYPTKYNWKIALVYNSSMAHMFTSLMLRLLTSRFESKSFNNIEKAVNWLKEDSK